MKHPCFIDAGLNNSLHCFILIEIMYTVLLDTLFFVHNTCDVMSRYKKHPQPSPETRDEAMKIALGTQRPGQTKEQTKLIAQGIQKGIDLYKKQHKAKARELDRQRNKPSRENTQHADSGSQEPGATRYRQHWLPWLLLVISWLAIALYFVFPGVLN